MKQIKTQIKAKADLKRILELCENYRITYEEYNKYEGQLDDLTTLCEVILMKMQAFENKGLKKYISEQDKLDFDNYFDKLVEIDKKLLTIIRK